jgi:hypothetical protein
MGQYLSTKQKAYTRFLNGVGQGAEAGDLSTTERTHSYFFAGSGDPGDEDAPVSRSYKMGQSDNGVQLAFEMSANNTSVTIEFWAKPHYGDLEYVGTYTIAAGGAGAAVSERGQYWAGTITLGDEEWVDAPEIIDTGNDRMARIKLDGTGAEYIFANVTAVNVAGTVSCYARGY